MSKQIAIIWISRYACSGGIRQAEAELLDSDMAAVRVGPGSYTQYYHKGDWFLTREEAQRDAEDRRQKKIASHQRSIAKLEKMDFSAEAKG